MAAAKVALNDLAQNTRFEESIKFRSDGIWGLTEHLQSDGKYAFYPDLDFEQELENSGRTLCPMKITIASEFSKALREAT